MQTMPVWKRALGASLCAIGPEFIAPRVVDAWSDHLSTRMAIVVLGSILTGILFVLCNSSSSPP